MPRRLCAVIFFAISSLGLPAQLSVATNSPNGAPLSERVVAYTIDARLDTAKKTLEEMGGQFRSVYMTMGAYDLVMIYDAPDDAVAARFTLMLGQLGNVRSTSLKAFPEEAFRQIVNTLR